MICETLSFPSVSVSLRKKQVKVIRIESTSFLRSGTLSQCPLGKPSWEKSLFFVTKALRPLLALVLLWLISITAGRYPPGDIILNTEKMRECQFDFFIQLDYYQGTGVHSVMKSKRRKSADAPMLPLSQKRAEIAAGFADHVSDLINWMYRDLAHLEEER